jgi:hypothetical protein
MFRVNDSVYHVFNMGKVGRVTGIVFAETGMHLTGGTAQQKMVLVVEMPDGRVVHIPADEAMKAEP